MKKIYPTDKPMFLVCEDVRPETGNKATFIGVYMGDILVTPYEKVEEKAAINLSSLTCIMSFKDGEGEFDGEMSLIQPDGVTSFTQKFDKIIKASNEPVNLALKMSPIGVVSGKYAVKVKLDDVEYIDTFTITIQNPISQ